MYTAFHSKSENQRSQLCWTTTSSSIGGDDPWPRKEADALHLEVVQTLRSHARPSLVSQITPPPPRCASVRAYYRRHRRQLLWLLLYTVGNAAAFCFKTIQYPKDAVVGYGLTIARGCAQVVMLNSLLVLLPLCRSVFALVRLVPVLSYYVPIEQALVFHKLSGSVLLLAGLVHVGAHVGNLAFFFTLPRPADADASYVKAMIPLLRDATKTWPALGMLCTSLPFWTGGAMLVIVTVAVPLAVLPCVRRRHFNVFWYSHLLFLLFLVLLSFHGATSWFSTAQSYLWIWPPLCVYLLERRVRVAKRAIDAVRISDVVRFRDTLRLRLVKPKSFAFVPGMFVYVNIPSLAACEWHPFTLTSAPDDAWLSLHIRVAGDWTLALYNRDLLPNEMLFLDGPLGAPAVAYREYATIVLVGGGIGITPFISILRDLLHVWNRHQCVACDHLVHPPSCVTQRVHLFWVAREEESFEWFHDTMQDVARLDVNGIVDVQCFLTASDAMAVTTTARQVVHRGRPSWPHVFQRLSVAHADDTIGVFHCGAKTMARDVRAACASYSNATTHFSFHAEQFE
ncbi:hypothetical protein SPRG_04777 [Saprolegnia parasitica CBS 223.65]|uniref:FAD-binding FR-type domain-containing protein n=1 Tax=Saprolegnia parasitica (strain CBS 223.65) TaxID=695850 RepID=A0A067CNR0_SAPPC|nr:hypothetical protein SPRG_04777 [Saprolegnia parasitica CBS 223.65]KDO30875.1 hypothetical protein SPRG_04777 [Saprolegnia parasitica CBS 223.65]|eukprot:XP_012198570.1 hypothetical protein SPRG_04777 [Saprolegnia parasitica CBS 223.65]